MKLRDRKRASTPVSNADEGDIVLSAHDITVSLDDKLILDKLSLDIRRGEILGFVGASGAGKSVLLRTILGLLRKQSGTIKLFGVDVDKASDMPSRWSALSKLRRMSPARAASDCAVSTARATSFWSAASKAPAISLARAAR